MKLFINWLDSIGQDPKTVVRDAIWFLVRSCVLMFAVLLPIMVASAPVVRPLLSKTLIKSPWFYIGFGIYIFSAVSILTVLLGGWYKLSRNFRAPRGWKEGQLFQFQSASIVSAGYNSVLKIRIAPQGFYLACIPPFSLMHRPILIPWNEMRRIRQEKEHHTKEMRLIVGSPKLCSVVLKNGKVIEAVKQYLP